MATRRAADPKYSEGARYERRAMRSMLRRRIGAAGAAGAKVYDDILQWVVRRQERYDKKPGGL